jgi:hypothetical protein
LRHNRGVTVRPDPRLAVLALAKIAGVFALMGLVIGIAMTFSGESPWSILGAPVALGVLGGLTLGSALAASWWLIPGRVSITLVDGFLMARRGQWLRKQVPVERIADIQFDQRVGWRDLVFRGWFGYESAIPTLLVTLTATTDRWDPSNSTTVWFPRMLIAGEQQRRAISDLRRALGLPPLA